MRLCLVLALLSFLPGCATDDYSRPGTWHATGVNDANLRAMLAERAQAYRGVGANTERGQPGSLAVRRLEQGRRQPLPDSRVSRVGPAGGEDTGTSDAR
jgi:hypothetical protein